MKKERFHVSITNSSISDEYNTIGHYDENTLEFYENDKLKSKININLKEKKLIKENIDYKIEIEFNIDKETECLINLKREKKEFILKVKTLQFEFIKNKLKIYYSIIDSDEYFTYQIYIGI